MLIFKKHSGVLFLFMLNQIAKGARFMIIMITGSMG